MSDVEPSTRVRRSVGIAWELIDDRVVVFAERDAQLHTFNRSASVMWQCFDGTTIADLARELASAFEMPVSQIERDACDLVAQLAASDLVELPPPD